MSTRALARLAVPFAVIAVIAISSLSTPASALSVAGGGAWGTPGNNGKDAQFGPTGSQTCFLSGVSGNFVGNPALNSQPNIGLRASVEVVESNGFWVLRTRAGVGTGVMGYVTCVNATANRVDFSWQDNLTIQGVPATPNRQCFLSSVWATTGLSGQVGALVTNLTIRKTNNTFDLNSSYVQNIGGDFDFGGATARCVDIAPSMEWGFTLFGPTNADNSATATTILRNSFPNGTPVPVADVGCFITAISGRWINPNPDPLGWADGAFLTGPSFHPPASPDWQMTLSNGRSATAACLK